MKGILIFEPLYHHLELNDRFSKEYHIYHIGLLQTFHIYYIDKYSFFKNTKILAKANEPFNKATKTKVVKWLKKPLTFNLYSFLLWIIELKLYHEA